MTAPLRLRMNASLRLKALPILAVAFLASGCATYGLENIYRTTGSGGHRHQVDRDVDRYVAQVDRNIRLNRRDERAINRLLRDRTHQFIERMRPEDRRYAYPFPRRSERSMNRAEYDFWRDADRAIERRLPRVQARRYAALTSGRDGYERGRSDRHAKRDRRGRGRR